MEVLRVNAITVRERGKEVLTNLSFSVGRHEQWAITGPSGSGKTSLLQALSRRQFNNGSITINDGRPGSNEKIVLVEQQHHFKNLSNTNNFYYQQRFNSSDAEDAITVEEALLQSLPGLKEPQNGYTREMEVTLDKLRLRSLLQVKLIQLSNGEHKRLQIAKALLAHPTILLLDNPFTGLDVQARKVLAELLYGISRETHIILVTSPYHLPEFVTHVLSLEKEGNYFTETVEVFRQRAAFTNHPSAFMPDESLLKELVSGSPLPSFEFAVKMDRVSVQYNNRIILDDVSWEIRNGERWSLSGPNGSGKSTLLSLINADNPQAYANNIFLFDRKRGSGETIWEIKKQIGFVSPELHLYFDSTINCFEVVSSGLFDTIGLFRLLNEVQSALVLKWMRLLHIEHTRSKLLFQLSNSEQRLVLLARALVKNPPLLVLDEPCQGLDDDQVFFFRSIVDEVCMLTGKTLIYVSHYPHEIPACVNKFIRLENGRTVQ